MTWTNLAGVKVTIRFLSKNILAFAFGALILPSLVGAQNRPGNAAYNWLDGQWSGRPPDGGELQMTLQVINDNQIRGTGEIPGGGRKEDYPSISGTVRGKHITFETYFPGRQKTVRYRCTAVKDSLECKTRAGYQTTFTKNK